MHGRVVDALGLQIMSGRIASETVIDTEEVAATFDVSRTVVREALKVLAGKGLIDARPRRGTFVRERSAWNLLDPDVLRWQFSSATSLEALEKLHEVRMMVEPAAAELAAHRRTQEDVKQLFAAIEGMSREGATAEEISECDRRFHMGLIAATHNELIEQLSVIISIGLSSRDQLVLKHRVPIASALEMHRKIAFAVERSDPEEARIRMFALLDAAATDVRGLGLDQH